jgi:hypothetical protein
VRITVTRTGANADMTMGDYVTDSWPIRTETKTHHHAGQYALWTMQGHESHKRAHGFRSISPEKLGASP